MREKGIAVGLVLLGLVWFYFAFESYGRGKLAIGVVQAAAGLAFAGRGMLEWSRHSRRKST